MVLIGEVVFTVLGMEPELMAVPQSSVLRPFLGVYTWYLF